MKDKIVITVTKQNIRFYLILFIIVGISLLVVAIQVSEYNRNHLVDVTGYCKDISDHNITINAATYYLIGSLEDGKEHFVGHDVRLVMYYSDLYDCYFWRLIECIK